MKSLSTEMLCKAPNRQAKANRLVEEKGGRSRTKESNNEQHSFRNTDQKVLYCHWGEDFFSQFLCSKCIQALASATCFVCCWHETLPSKITVLRISL